MNARKLVCVVAMVGGCAIDTVGDGDTEVATSGVAQAATQADVWHATWNGGSANASFWGPLGGGYLDVFEDRSAQTRSAYMTFSTWSVDPDSLQCFSWTDWWGMTWDWCSYTRSTYSSGWGLIPESDAQLNPNSARVRTTLGSDFSGTQCVYDWTVWEPAPCTPLAGGTIDVRWHEDGGFSTFHSGTTQSSYGPYTFKSQGTFRSSSARPVGSVLGVDFSSGYGHFGTTRGVNVSKSIVKTSKP